MLDESRAFTLFGSVLRDGHKSDVDQYAVRVAFAARSVRVLETAKPPGLPFRPLCAKFDLDLFGETLGQVMADMAETGRDGNEKGDCGGDEKEYGEVPVAQPGTRPMSPRGARDAPIPETTGANAYDRLQVALFQGNRPVT